MNKERLNQVIDNALVVSKEVGNTNFPSPSERTKIKELLKDPTLKGFQRDALEKYLESLQ